MHTRAAESQTLFKHSLAYVKQNVLVENSGRSFIAFGFLAILLVASGCVTIPRPANSVTVAMPAVSSVDRTQQININTASKEALEALPGVGRGIAERIVAHRQQYGPFRRAEHLMMVRGVSDKKFRELRSMIVVE
jgi:competence ComEA-like helix-hairpin-helix protein